MVLQMSTHSTKSPLSRPSRCAACSPAIAAEQHCSSPGPAAELRRRRCRQAAELRRSEEPPAIALGRAVCSVWYRDGAATLAVAAPEGYLTLRLPVKCAGKRHGFSLLAGADAGGACGRQLHLAACLFYIVTQRARPPPAAHKHTSTGTMLDLDLVLVEL